MKNYDFVASLGENCACAGLLNTLYLRRESSPFDWVTNIEFKQRIKLVLNNFPNFVNKKYLKFLGQNPEEPAKDSYVHTLYGTTFLHDFPSGQPLEKSLPAIDAKYARRALRFSNHLRKEKTLLVYIAKDPLPQELLVQSTTAINQKYHSNKIALLYIEHNPTLSMTQTIEKTIGNNLFWVQLNNTPTDNTDAFLRLQGNIPTVNDVICRYVWGNTYAYYVKVFCSRKRKVLFGVARLAACFCVFTKPRKALRRYLFCKIVDWLF